MCLFFSFSLESDITSAWLPLYEWAKICNTCSVYVAISHDYTFCEGGCLSALLYFLFLFYSAVPHPSLAMCGVLGFGGLSNLLCSLKQCYCCLSWGKSIIYFDSVYRDTVMIKYLTRHSLRKEKFFLAHYLRRCLSRCASRSMKWSHCVCCREAERWMLAFISQFQWFPHFNLVWDPSPHCCPHIHYGSYLFLFSQTFLVTS